MCAAGRADAARVRLRSQGSRIRRPKLPVFAAQPLLSPGQPTMRLIWRRTGVCSVPATWMSRTPRPGRVRSLTCARAFVLSLSAVLALAAPAAALDPSKLVSQYGFDQWRARDGLPHDVGQRASSRPATATCGWDAGGLARFDGVAFTVFEPATPRAAAEQSHPRPARSPRRHALDRRESGGSGPVPATGGSPSSARRRRSVSSTFSTWKRIKTDCGSGPRRRLRGSSRVASRSSAPAKVSRPVLSRWRRMRAGG